MTRALKPAQPRGFGKRASLGRPVQLRSEPSDGQLLEVIETSYRQLLNRVPLAAERLGDAESQLRNGSLSVADFIGQIALSDLFQQRLLRMAPLRSATAAYLALLGRAAQPAEVSRFLAVRSNSGQRAAIEEILASGDYASSFGRDTVPYLRGLNTSDGQPLSTVNRTAQLYGGNAALNPPLKEPI
jgi:phycobilisome core-membrane linker protein